MIQYFFLKEIDGKFTRRGKGITDKNGMIESEWINKGGGVLEGKKG